MTGAAGDDSGAVLAGTERTEDRSPSTTARRRPQLLAKWYHLGAMLDSGELTRTALRTAWHLLDHYNVNAECAWPSQDRLAERAGVHRRSVRRAIKELEATGWISVRRHGRGRGRASEYVPVWEKGANLRRFDKEETGAETRRLPAENGALTSDEMAQSCPANGAEVRHHTVKDTFNDTARESHARSRSRPKIDLAEHTFTDEERDLISDFGLDPDDIQARVRDWAVNVPPAKRRKIDVKAFLRNWCRDKAPQQRRGNGPDACPPLTAPLAYPEPGQFGLSSSAICVGALDGGHGFIFDVPGQGIITVYEDDTL